MTDMPREIWAIDDEPNGMYVIEPYPDTTGTTSYTLTSELAKAYEAINNLVDCVYLYSLDQNDYWKNQTKILMEKHAIVIKTAREQGE